MQFSLLWLLGRLVVGDDDDRGTANRDARILVRRRLDAASDHEPDMDAVGHAIRIESLANGRRQFLAIEPDVEIDGFGSLVQPVQVLVEEGDLPPMEAKPFPDSVAENEAAVEHGYPGLVAWE